MNKLTVGVIGLGLGRHFVSACESSAHVDRLVVCDPDEKRQVEIQKQFPSIATGYATVDEMLSAESLDAVCVVTPDHLHRNHAEACLQAGCHVLMTKPLATNLEDAKAIVRKAEHTGKTLMVAHERRFRSKERELQRVLGSGVLGEIILMQADQISDKRDQFQKSPWYASPEAGRTAIVGTGIHEIDLLRFLAGRPIKSISAFSNRLGDMEFPLSKTTATVIQFEGGAIGQTAVSYEAHWPKGGQPKSFFQIVCTMGVVYGDRYKLDSEEMWRPLPVDENGITTGCTASVFDFLECILQGTDPPVTARDAYATLAACIAADESASTGAVRVPSSEHFS